MDISHETTVGFAKSFGLFYLFAFFILATIYAYWPSLRGRFDKAANSILDDEDGPCQ